ncbi:MAG: hypothetical protein PVG07_01165, partial [Acidobacteriota bacterium]
GFLSYLAGRPLVGREIACGGGVDGVPCRFVVGTASRIEKLLDPPEESADAELLATLRASGRPEPADDAAEGS